MSDDLLLTDKSDPRVWVLKLNRPDQRNAIATSLLQEIANTLEAADRNETVCCAIIWGGETIWAAGADIGEMADRDALGATNDVRPRLWARVQAFSKPLIAAVHGYCLGAGNELLLRCDIAVAAEDAQFGQPELNVGIMPGAGGTQILPRLVGKMAAMRMVLLGDFLTAQEALAYGLVTEVAPAGEVFERAQKIAKKITFKPPMAVRLAKQSILETMEVPLSAGLQGERRAFSLLFGTEDKNEGVLAFQEKRKPAFKGK